MSPQITPIADAAQDHFWIDVLRELFQIRIVRRIGAHGAILHGTSDAVGDQFADGSRLKIAIGFDVHDEGLFVEA